MITPKLTDSEMWEFFDKVFIPKVDNILNKMSIKGLWYEVRYDLEETFKDKWLRFAYNYPNLAAYNAARWMIRRDKWYWSPDYVKELNDAMSKGCSPEAALTVVLQNSLK